jgi:hypothetical protein
MFGAIVRIHRRACARAGAFVACATPIVVVVVVVFRVWVRVRFSVTFLAGDAPCFWL